MARREWRRRALARSEEISSHSMIPKAHLAFHVAAEVEAFLFRPANAWRRRELRSLGVEFGENISTRRHFKIHRWGGIRIGARAAFGDYTQLLNFTRIEIGDDFLSAGNLIVTTGTHDPITLTPGAAPVRIGSRVWCGMGVTILAGVVIGDDVVIGAGSLVNKDIPGNSVAAGVPARVLRSLDRPAGLKLWNTTEPGEPSAVVS